LYPVVTQDTQHATIGLLSEYGQIEETISVEVLKDIYEWIIKK
jgi:hypothetical protein